MVYLGTYHRLYATLMGNNPWVFSEPPYELVHSLRQNLQLPDFFKHSLDRAWPFMQGVSGGLIRVTQCANEHCKRLPIPTSLSLDGPLGFCFRHACYIWYMVQETRHASCPTRYHQRSSVNRRPSIKEGSRAQVQHYQRQLICLWQPPTVLQLFLPIHYSRRGKTPYTSNISAFHILC